MNRCEFTGRLVRDPEVRYTQSGTAVATFTIAVDRPFAKKDQDAQQADFIPIVAWRKLAEICSNNLLKGRLVGITGRIQVRSYDGQDGKKRYVTEIVADDVEFLDSKKKDGGNAQSTGGTGWKYPEPEDDEPIPF